jgi:hypothetical protein
MTTILRESAQDVRAWVGIMYRSRGKIRVAPSKFAVHCAHQVQIHPTSTNENQTRAKG